MAITDSTTKWPLLEQVPDGPIKENLIELQGHLEEMLKARDILLTLYNYAEEVQDRTITMANETVSTLGVMIDSNVDAVFHHLNQIFNPESQAAPVGGE